MREEAQQQAHARPRLMVPRRGRAPSPRLAPLAEIPRSVGRGRCGLRHRHRHRSPPCRPASPQSSWKLPKSQVAALQDALIRAGQKSRRTASSDQHARRRQRLLHEDWPVAAQRRADCHEHRRGDAVREDDRDPGDHAEGRDGGRGHRPGRHRVRALGPGQVRRVRLPRRHLQADHRRGQVEGSATSSILLNEFPPQTIAKYNRGQRLTVDGTLGKDSAAALTVVTLEALGQTDVFVADDLASGIDGFIAKVTGYLANVGKVAAPKVIVVAPRGVPDMKPAFRILTEGKGKGNAVPVTPAWKCLVMALQVQLTA